jgi:hypothetical protein
MERLSGPSSFLNFYLFFLPGMEAEHSTTRFVAARNSIALSAYLIGPALALIIPSDLFALSHHFERLVAIKQKKKIFFFYIWPENFRVIELVISLIPLKLCEK